MPTKTRSKLVHIEVEKTTRSLLHLYAASIGKSQYAAATDLLNTALLSRLVGGGGEFGMLITMITQDPEEQEIWRQRVVEFNKHAEQAS